MHFFSLPQTPTKLDQLALSKEISNTNELCNFAPTTHDKISCPKTNERREISKLVEQPGERRERKVEGDKGRRKGRTQRDSIKNHPRSIPW